MVGPSPDEEVREDNGDWNRRRRGWQMYPADKSEVPFSPSPLKFPRAGTAERRKAGPSGEKLEISIPTRESTR